jgi:hypothetical protein
MARVVVGTPDPPKFFTTAWSAPAIAVRFPSQCPHCGGEATRRRRYSTARPTSMSAAHFTETHLVYEVPVCRRVWPALLTRLAVVFFAFWAVTFGLVVAFSVLEGPHPIAIALLVAALAGVVWAARAHTWFRVVTFDRGSVTFAARRKAYADELLRLNA